ncbi:hypothetical protein ABZT03_36670 [Streptomyces sp. NPDC005574]|uniref:hypothetical protein n=1 Tax=Streptomyces sp. NPDC005574 TaxID=3156891 RepID=UPI0033B219F2
MSDQHAATTLTAVAVIATILMARVAILHGNRSRSTHCSRRRTPSRAAQAAAPAADAEDSPASTVVQEAEQYVYRCWQHHRKHAGPSR